MKTWTTKEGKKMNICDMEAAERNLLEEERKKRGTIQCQSRI